MVVSLESFLNNRGRLSSMGRRKDLVVRIVKIFLSVLLFAGVVSYIGVGKIIHALLSMDLFYLPFIFIFFAIIYPSLL